MNYGKIKVMNFDSQYLYQGYNKDFGPLNIGYINIYCKEIQDYLRQDKVVIHHCTPFPKIMCNQIMLVASYLILCHKYNARNSLSKFDKIDRDLVPYCDSGSRFNSFSLTNFDCMHALEKAI